jgi:hypothetical protein
MAVSFIAMTNCRMNAEDGASATLSIISQLPNMKVMAIRKLCNGHITIRVKLQFA